MTPRQQALNFWLEYRAFLSLPGAPLGELKDAIAKSLTIDKCRTIISTIDDSMLYKETKRKFWADVLIEAESLKIS
jgi:hypothetical protein